MAIINFCRNIFTNPNIKPLKFSTVQFIYNKPSVVFMMNPKTTHVQFRLDTLSYIAKKR